MFVVFGWGFVCVIRLIAVLETPCVKILTEVLQQLVNKKLKLINILPEFFARIVRRMKS